MPLLTYTITTSPSATLPMSSIEDTLRELIKGLTEENYDETFAKYRFWLDIGSAYASINAQERVDRDVSTLERPDLLQEPIHPTAHLLLRFIGDIEADPKNSNRVSGLHMQHCASTLTRFFVYGLYYARSGSRPAFPKDFLTCANLIARWANLGYVGEGTIRDHVLQSLTTGQSLHNYQAEALFILFKLAGATFEAYADLSVVDHCFELLENHWGSDSTKVQEVVGLRNRGWEGLHPPPIFASEKAEPVGANQKDPAATPIMTSLGIPNRDLGPQVPQPPLPEPIVAPEADTIPGSPTSHSHSPSLSISTLSDFTVADTSDDEPPLDPTAKIPHDTFYLEDGNVEVLCGNTLFRVHASTLSFHSTVLGQMLTKGSLAAAESPDGCPRISSSDTATDFATLLKVVYLPVFPDRNKVPDFNTFSSLLRVTAKYEMPAVRSQLLDVVRDAYPETFKGLDPSKVLGEGVFTGPTPHPNTVLNLFVQQRLVSALPMAYYMAVRRGLDSLMDRHLPASARLSPEILEVAMKGLLTLRETELRETHRLIFGPRGSRPCSQSNCSSRNITGPRALQAHQEVIDRIADSVHSGTNILQVLSLKEVCGDDCLGFCKSCVDGWEAGHANVRKNTWAVLPSVFGL